MEPPFDVASLYSAERTRLLDTLAGLTSADWQAFTPCPGWTVLDIACHLVGDDLGLLARQRDGHQGTTPPAGADFAEWLDRLQDDWVRACRRVSPTLAVDLLRWTGSQVTELMKGQDPAALEGHVTWASDQLVPRWLDQAREFTEGWLHRQQIRQALGQPEDLTADLFEPLLDTLRWAYPHQLRDHPRPDGTTITIAIGPPTNRIWHLVADAGRWDHRDAPGNPTVLTIALTASQAWRLPTNNLPRSQQSTIRLDGPPDLAAAVLSCRAVIGRPT